MKFLLTVKLGQQVMAEVEGRDIEPSTLSVADVRGVVDLEQKLERLFGLRFHINERI